MMKQPLKYIGYVILLLLLAFLVWRFWFIIVWILVAAVISFIGHPLVRFFDKLRLGKWRIPHTASAVLSLAIILLIFLGLLSVFVPLIISQAATVSMIDVNSVAEHLRAPLQWLNDQAHFYGLIPQEQAVGDMLVAKVKSLVNLGNITTLVSSFFNVAGTIFIGLFSVIFIAFFFLKDENMFEESLLLLVPVKHHAATREVIKDSKALLVRYFIGVLLEILGVMLIIALGLTLFGVKNALLIGFFGGIMNIIPYLGPVIGSLIGIVLGITTTLAYGNFNDLLPVILKLTGVFALANFIDNNVLVPLIYSKSVKAHPLEIFIVIIMGGSLAGIAGMLLAIPVYTILRVIAREFFHKYRLVKKITESIIDE